MLSSSTLPAWSAFTPGTPCLSCQVSRQPGSQQEKHRPRSGGFCCGTSSAPMGGAALASPLLFLGLSFPLSQRGEALADLSDSSQLWTSASDRWGCPVLSRSSSRLQSTYCVWALFYELHIYNSLHDDTRPGRHCPRFTTEEIGPEEVNSLAQGHDSIVA